MLLGKFAAWLGVILLILFMKCFICLYGLSSSKNNYLFTKLEYAFYSKANFKLISLTL